MFSNRWNEIKLIKAFFFFVNSILYFHCSFNVHFRFIDFIINCDISKKIQFISLFRIIQRQRQNVSLFYLFFFIIINLVLIVFYILLEVRVHSVKKSGLFYQSNNCLISFVKI